MFREHPWLNTKTFETPLCTHNSLNPDSKIGSPIVAVRRGGSIHAFDSMMHFIHIQGMISIGSIPIAICLFLMMYPIMVKIDFASVVKAGKNGKPMFLTLFINWCIKPFTMYAIAMLFLGFLFRTFIGVDAIDLVKMPFGLNLPIGAQYGSGTVVYTE